MPPTYFDHNATTPVDPRVRLEMVPWLEDRFGNPSSIHSFGQQAREAVEAAREEVARLLGVAPPEIVFTASGTEANNTILQALCQRQGGPGHLVVSAVEHPSVENPARALEARGWEVTWIEPDSQGVIDACTMNAAIRHDTVVVALVLANNLVGTVQPVAEVAACCRQFGVPLMCDAVQAIGKIDVQAEELGVDYLALGAHKFYGPLGAAALWVRQGVALEPLLLGGAQERHRRAGTQNVPAIVGLGKAAELARLELDSRRQHLLDLRRRFEVGMETLPDTVVHGAGAERLPNTSHIAFLGTDSQSLLIRLDLAGFAVSAGSACSSGTLEVSRTLVGMGVSQSEAKSAIRVSFGQDNSRDEVDRFVEVLTAEVADLRRLTPATP